MHPDIAIPAITAAEFSGQSERRHGSRTPTLFLLLYSCMDSGKMLIGEGAVTDLSSKGIGISGESTGQAWGDRNPLSRPARNGRTILYYPKPSFLGQRMSIWSGDGDSDVGGEESSAIFLVNRAPYLDRASGN